MSSNSLKMSFPMLDCQGEILKITTQSHVDHVNDTLTHFYGKKLYDKHTDPLQRDGFSYEFKSVSISGNVGIIF